MASGCRDPRAVVLGTSCKGVVSFKPRPLCPRGKSPLYQLDSRLGEPQSRSGRYGDVRVLDSTGNRTPTPWSSSSQPVAVPKACWCLAKQHKASALEILILNQACWCLAKQHKASALQILILNQACWCLAKQHKASALQILIFENLTNRMPCSPLKRQTAFRKDMSPPSSG
jgi:hypothetical protein